MAYIYQKYPIESWLVEVSFSHVMYFLLITLILILLSALRLQILLSPVLPVSRAVVIRITFISHFVGLGLPSSLGADDSKLFYLCSVERFDKKFILKTLILNRALALFGVLWVGLLGTSHIMTIESSIFISSTLMLSTLLVFVFWLRKKSPALLISIIMALLVVVSVDFYIRFILDYNEFEGLFLKLSLFPVVETVPLSWHGLGISHLGLQQILKRYSLNGFAIYNVFF